MFLADSSVRVKFEGKRNTQVSEANSQRKGEVVVLREKVKGLEDVFEGLRAQLEDKEQLIKILMEGKGRNGMK